MAIQVLWMGVWWTPSGLEIELLMLMADEARVFNIPLVYYTEAARVAYFLAIGGF